MMGRRTVYAALLALCLAVFLNGNWAYGLFESSEARYSEVAREMVATGDYLSPQIDYVYHFTKPPLAYWVTAAGYHIFGQNEFGARFFVAVAGAFSVLLCAMIYADARKGNGLLAGVILLCSAHFFAITKVVTTDMFLTLIIVSGFYLWTRYEGGGVSTRTFSWLSGLLAALAFITKGPVGLLFWVIVLVPYTMWKDRGASLRPLLSWRFWFVFSLVGLPWFVAVGFKHPGLLQYLIFRESAEAAVSAKRFHPGPWYYYFLVFLGGFFPWWFVAFSRFKRALATEVRLWLLWATVPVLVWSIFPAKLPTYILPCIPAWALLTAYLLEVCGFSGRALAALLSGGVLFVSGSVLLFLLVNPLGWPQVGPLAFGLMVACTLVALVGVMLGVSLRSWASFRSAVAAIVLFQLAVPYLCDDLHEKIRIKSDLGRAIAAMRAPGEPVLEYRATIYSVPFYMRDKVFVYQNGFVRKKFLDENLPPHILTSRSELYAFLSSPGRIWILTDKSEEEGLQARAKDVSLVMRHGIHSLWVHDPHGAPGTQPQSPGRAAGDLSPGPG